MAALQTYAIRCFDEWNKNIETTNDHSGLMDMILLDYKIWEK